MGFIKNLLISIVAGNNLDECSTNKYPSNLHWLRAEYERLVKRENDKGASAWRSTVMDGNPGENTFLKN